MNAVAHAQLKFQMLTWTSKISAPPEPVKKTWDSKCMALAAQMVRAFGMNPKVRCSSFPQGETFYA